MSINTADKVYFAYTPYIPPEDQWEFAIKDGQPFFIEHSRARGTLALQRIGNEIHYGMTVCSVEDNFNKKEGRALAESRMKSEWGKFSLDPVHVATFKDDHELSLYFLNNIVNSMAADIRKTQHKIGIRSAKKAMPKLLTSVSSSLHKI